MKKVVLTAIILLFFLPLKAQKNPVTVASGAAIRETLISESDQSGLKIFPVPVKDNSFSVTSEKEISLIRITNIIGQETYRSRFPSPVLTTRVFLDNPQRGFYLVTVVFTDNTRVVRKIMIESM
ncbi:MAG: T9SS type A sorting domain-containing protein [Bacteroidales bacterium]